MKRSSRFPGLLMFALTVGLLVAPVGRAKALSSHNYLLSTMHSIMQLYGSPSSYSCSYTVYSSGSPVQGTCNRWSGSSYWSSSTFAVGTNYDQSAFGYMGPSWGNWVFWAWCPNSGGESACEWGLL